MAEDNHKNAIWALLISQLASDTDRCNPLHVNRTQNKHLPLAVCRLLRPSSLYLNEQERTFLLIEAVADLSLVKTPSKVYLSFFPGLSLWFCF